MSFADLQSARQGKRGKSFVAASSKSKSMKNSDQESSHAEADMQVEESHAQLSPSDTGLEARLTSNVKILRDEYTGRGLYTKGRVQPGTVLMFSKPQINILSTQFLGAHCSYCCEPQSGSSLKRCTRCRQMWYCNATCQNSDWGVHKNECSALQRWKTNAPSVEVDIPSEAVRCLGRILWIMQKEGFDSDWTKDFNTMQSHRTSLPPSAVQSHTHLAHAVVQYLGVSSPAELTPFGLSSAADLVDLISRFTTNTFTLSTSSLTPIGICASPSMALVNHSCDPNAVMLFPHSSADPPTQRPNMQLIAIKYIGPNEQVLASYIDVTLPRELRQRDLKNTYNFVCKCTLCSQNDEESDPRTSMWCPKSCGGTCPVPVEDSDVHRCTRCRAVVSATESVIDALRVGQEAIDKATSVRFHDPAKAQQLTSNMIPIMTSVGLTPSSHPLLAMYRLHLELLVSSFGGAPTQDVLDEAIRTSAKYNAGLSNILCRGHPVRGVAIAELGKLLAVDEPSPRSPDSNNRTVFPPSGPPRLQLARETLVRALEELMIGFGKNNGGGEVGQQVREIIVRLEGEIGVWNQGMRNVLEDTRAARSGNGSANASRR